MLYIDPESPLPLSPLLLHPHNCTSGHSTTHNHTGPIPVIQIYCSHRTFHPPPHTTRTTVMITCPVVRTCHPQQTLNLTTCNNDTRRVEGVIIIGLPPCFGFVPPYLWLYRTGNVALNCAGGPTSCIYYLLCAQCTKYMLFATKSSGNGH